MNPLSLGCRVLVVMAIVCFPATPAWAQRPTGPYAGLFGVGGESEETAHSLELRGAFFGSWDDVVVRTPDSAALDPLFLTNSTGTGAGAHGTLLYVRRTDAVWLSTGGDSDVRVYPGSNDARVVSYGTNATLGANLGSHVTVNTNGSASYSSFYQFAPFLAAGVGDVGPLAPGFGFASGAERNRQLTANAGLVIKSSRRSSVSADVNWSEWRFLDRPEFSVAGRGALGAFRYQMTRALGVRAGYGYSEGRYGFAGTRPVEMQTIDVGVDYGDTLEFARRTALTFGSSTSAVRIDGSTYYRVNGAVALSRGFRRTWRTSVGYARTTDFVAGFRAPVLSDSASAEVGGLLNRRVMWTAGAGYSHGTVGFGNSSSSSFSAYSGATRLELGVTRLFGVFGQYALYYYRAPTGSTVAELLPRFRRQAVTAGLTLWVPIFNGVRTTRDTK